MALSDDAREFYRVELNSIAEYDSEGGAGDGGGNGGGGPGGGGPQPGTGNPTDGYVFSFGDVPPMQNLLLDIKVGTTAATVEAFFSQGPQGGTISLSFDDRGMASGSSVRATFSHSPPGRGTITETSTNTYTKP